MITLHHYRSDGFNFHSDEMIYHLNMPLSVAELLVEEMNRQYKYHDDEYDHFYIHTGKVVELDDDLDKIKGVAEKLVERYNS